MPLEKDKILEFSQYMESGKIPYIIYADIKSLIKKKQIDVQVIQKIIQQQKLESIFLVNIQCQLYGRLYAANVINFEGKKMLLLTKKS